MSATEIGHERKMLKSATNILRDCQAVLKDAEKRLTVLEKKAKS